ncbi:hypothetical protein BEL04_08000 [Mucilaginibacter sp. PPCGB 2223]|uniref:hypothetical protein n=1 Tax=Mucilaginibacter sp. PPCGB 2223 TaxID=1886027 RepID=UPI00082551F6|nr:hypothetical protein [Mucilaginibacter sp. PPCGB 2223]OCX54194.1 hypothetical protein BEL04_08000 [Mucilaginibacter sp. PPCGB 2223]
MDITPETFFYEIPLENDEMILKKSVLFSHYHPPAEDKRYSDRASVRTASFERDIYKLLVDLHKEKKHHLYVHIERSHLFIACECGMPEHALCKHAYYGLFYLMHYKDMSLKPYYWPELQQEIDGGYKYIDVHAYDHHVDITPKIKYGNLYKIGLGFSSDDVLTFDNKKSDTIPVGNKEILGYAIVYTSAGRRSSHYTFLSPFVAKTSKDGKSIVSYYRYLRRDRHFVHSVDMSNEQIMLNERCFDMFEISKSAFKSDSNLKNLNWSEVIFPLLSLWQKAMPKLLQQENIVACHNFFGLRYWQDKPKKADMHKCKLSRDKICISFLLRERKEDYTLLPTIKVNNERLTDFDKISLFVIDKNSYSFYLVNSVQDEVLLNWLKLFGYKLTILKDHINDFKERFLNQISECYDVQFQSFGSKLKREYNPTINISSTDND